MSEARLLPVRGEVSQPGQDISRTQWQQLMRAGELALFCLDYEGKLLTLHGERAASPIAEYCTAYKSRFRAELVIQGGRSLYPHTTYALYDRQGRWLQTVSAAGTHQRNKYLQHLLKISGTLLLGLAILAGIYLLVYLYEPQTGFRGKLLLRDILGLAMAALFTGASARGTVYFAKLLYFRHAARRALERQSINQPVK